MNIIMHTRTHPCMHASHYVNYFVIILESQMKAKDIEIEKLKKFLNKAKKVLLILLMILV